MAETCKGCGKRICNGDGCYVSSTFGFGAGHYCRECVDENVHVSTANLEVILSLLFAGVIYGLVKLCTFLAK